MELLAFSVGIGLVIGIFCSEMLGMASSGLIVPGYIAIYLTQPKLLLATLLVAFATFGLVRLVAGVVLIHGRRRSVMMILIGYILGMLVNQLSGVWAADVAVIGFVIPGLIAMWMDRQGVLQTLSALAIVSVMVRLVLIVAGAELMAS